MTVSHEDNLVSIVVLGSFNPAIFHPHWFGTAGLIRVGEADAAAIQVVHPEVSEFSTDWLRVQVTRDRLHMQTEHDSEAEALRDLVHSVLLLLPHTPTRALGVNRRTVLRFSDRAEFDALGWALSPRDIWGQMLEEPGMVSVTERGVRTDGLLGHINVTVEPVLDGSFRAVASVNDHVEISETDDSESTERIAAVLYDRWNEMVDRASSLVDSVSLIGGRT